MSTDDLLLPKIGFLDALLSFLQSPKRLIHFFRQRRADGWYGRQDYYPLGQWDGPFETRELAASVRYDHAPGYLVCGLCGFDEWGNTKVVAHYRAVHPPGGGLPIDIDVGSRSQLKKMISG